VREREGREGGREGGFSVFLKAKSEKRMMGFGGAGGGGGGGMVAPLPTSTIYVCNLPSGTDENLLADHFGKIGLLKVRILLSPPPSPLSPLSSVFQFHWVIFRRSSVFWSFDFAVVLAVLWEKPLVVLLFGLSFLLLLTCNSMGPCPLRDHLF
jgi:hypothetical protein